ncbi:MAG: hypothetical protein R3A78_07995 [Polyangiales bacterium]|nr:hypothetical protein [Myxococcales bacterium]
MEHALALLVAFVAVGALGGLGRAMRRDVAGNEASHRPRSSASPSVGAQAAGGVLRAAIEAAERARGVVSLRASSFRRVIGDLAPEAFVDVPVRTKGEVEVFVLSDALPASDRATRSFLREHAALRPVTTENAAADGSAFATRYRRLTRRGELGDVRGDGRVVDIGSVDLHGADGRILDAEVQVKGVATGLRPRLGPGEVTAEAAAHQNGMHPLLGALVDAMMQEYAAANGISDNRAVGVVDLGERFKHVDAAADEIWGHASTEVRAGDFLRMAHLEELIDRPPALRAAFDVAKEQLRARGIAGDLESPTELFRALIEHKASQLVDLHWSRASHGATTLDNTGVVELLDMGSVTLTDRAHRGYQSSVNSAGYMLEGHEVLGLGAWKSATNRAYVPTLSRYMSVAFGVDEEQFRRLGTELAEAAYERAMTRGALEHVGIPAADRARLLAEDGPEVRAIRRAVQDVSRRRSNVSYELDGHSVARPATYDVFGALAELMASHAADVAHPGAGVDALIDALAPLDGARSEHELIARALLDAIAPLHERVVAGLSPELAEEKTAWMSRTARRTNESLDLRRRTAEFYVNKMLERYRVGEFSAERIEAELRAWVRGNVRRGPSMPDAVADGIFRRTPGRFDGDTAVLRDVREGGVRIRELSNGEHDWIEVRGEFGVVPEGWHLRYRGGVDVASHDVAPIRGSDGVRFRIPLRDGVESFEFEFVDPARPGTTRSRDGVPFGRNLARISSDPAVDGALAEWAESRGLVRRSTPEVRRALARVEGRRYRGEAR